MTIDTKLDAECDVRKIILHHQTTLMRLVEITRCKQPVTTSMKYQMYIEITIQ